MTFFLFKHFDRLTIIAICSLLTACGGNPYAHNDGPPSEQVDVSQIPDAVPQSTTRSKYGNPKSYVVRGKRYYVMNSSAGYKERGIASWYGSKFQGKRTSSGELYDMHKMTAAHKTLPLPTYVKVTNLKNNRHVILKVNDRGPFHENRIIDLSHTAAVKLGIKATGTGLVEVEAIDPNKAQTQLSSTPKTTLYTPNPPVSKVALFLQLGAFVDAHNAYQLKNRANAHLNKQQAKVSSTINNGQKFYRVRIGPLDHAEQADNLAQQLQHAGFSQLRIVIE